MNFLRLKGRTNAIDRFFERFNGSYIVFAGLTVSVVFLALTAIMYLAVNPDFSIFSNFISHLGLGPEEGKITFALAGTLMGFTYLVYFLFYSRYVEKRGKNTVLTWIAYLFALLFAINLILVCLIPFDPVNPVAYQVHIFSAILLFAGIVGLGVFYGIAELSANDIPILLPLISFIMAVLAGIFTTLFTIQTYNSTPYQTVTYFTEWLAVFGLIIWTAVHGMVTVKN
ncbi:MAG: DUF998 domain-containing protein [Candidatus Odinarchaeota archaeon]